jgi:hypothetical protein
VVTAAMLGTREKGPQGPQKNVRVSKRQATSTSSYGLNAVGFEKLSKKHNGRLLRKTLVA